jgi:hypothetical protein
MSILRYCPLLAVVILLIPITVQAQQRPRVSPHDVTSAVIDGNRVTIFYGRPYSKNPRGNDIRKIWGALVPFGQPWRLGANEATLLLTQRPLVIGSTTVPPGAYTLYMVPEENGGKLAISTAVGQWGIPVDEQHDLARVDLKKEALEPAVDQLTIAVASNPSGGGLIRIMWEATQYSVPFTVQQ